MKRKLQIVRLSRWFPLVSVIDVPGVPGFRELKIGRLCFRYRPVPDGYKLTTFVGF